MRQQLFSTVNNSSNQLLLFKRNCCRTYLSLLVHMVSTVGWLLHEGFPFGLHVMMVKPGIQYIYSMYMVTVYSLVYIYGIYMVYKAYQMGNILLMSLYVPLHHKYTVHNKYRII